jgi:metal-responsive CopG/Arc/MetJ family transcriptional regulator
MGYAKLSVTIPDKMYKEIKEFALKENIKISHIVSDALAEKAKKMREEALIQKINKVFKDPDVVKEQSSLAEMIADNTDVEELPW